MVFRRVLIGGVFAIEGGPLSQSHHFETWWTKTPIVLNEYSQAAEDSARGGAILWERLDYSVQRLPRRFRRTRKPMLSLGSSSLGLQFPASSMISHGRRGFWGLGSKTTGGGPQKPGDMKTWFSEGNETITVTSGKLIQIHM